MPEFGQFQCASSGDRWDIEGRPVAGTARAALARAMIRLDDHGRIVVDPSRWLIFERGEWEWPAAAIR